MPRFFIHLVDGEDLALDSDGIELSLEAVEQYALLNARDRTAGNVQNGLVDLHYRLEVHDDTGMFVHQLSFADAVKVVGG